MDDQALEAAREDRDERDRNLLIAGFSDRSNSAVRGKMEDFRAGFGLQRSDGTR